MNILFVHNNFPAQFRNLAEELVSRPGFSVTAIGSETAQAMRGVDLRRYRMPAVDILRTHPFARRFDIECRRATEVLYALSELCDAGYEADLIVGHCGWGETLPLRTMFPNAKIATYCEYYYRREGQDVHFDPESPVLGRDGLVGLHCKNAASLLALAESDLGLSPTAWQRQTYPPEFHGKIHVVHEGVDGERLRPDAAANFAIPGGPVLNRGQEVVTYIARSFEPMRGFHVFMRSLPHLLAARPNAQIVIVGGEGVSYGVMAPDGKSWKSVYLDEIAAAVDLNRVHFLPPQPYEAFIRLLQVSRVHVYLTVPFVLSWSLVEAMAAGCAIVASDTEPVREAIEHNVNGVLTPFLDPHALADRIADLLPDEPRRAKLGSAARGTALARFDRRECLARILSILGIDDLVEAKAATHRRRRG